MKFTTKTRDYPKDFKRKFYFVDGDRSAGIELRFIPDEEMAEARKRHTETVIEYVPHPRTGKLTRVETDNVDNDEFMKWFISTLIASFWGIIVDGKEIEVSDYNKQALFFGRNFDEKGKFTSVIDEEGVFKAFVLKSNVELGKIAKDMYGGKSKRKNS